MTNARLFPPLCLTVLILLAPACQHRYTETPVVGAAERPKLKTGSVIYVGVPADVQFKNDRVVDSGRLTAVAVREAFARFAKQAYLGRRVESLEEARLSAQAARAQYLVYPVVLRWEDRATEYTMRGDRLEVQLSIVDTVSGELLHSVVLEGRSRLFTDGGDTPQDLLQEPVTRYASSLFTVEHLPSALR